MMRRPGLLLVEVFVVLFVILVLTLLLLPAILRARESARTTQCANNMHQLLVNDSAAGRELLLICPADPTGSRRIDQNGTSYLRNRAIDLSNKKLALSKTITKFEAADEYIDRSVDPRQWFSQETNRNWQQVQKAVATRRHVNVVANYLYADGHVVAIPVEQIQRWANAGINFGMPNRGNYVP